jgi:LysW-gamma-L-lysine carboxypeptidase
MVGIRIPPATIIDFLIARIAQLGTNIPPYCSAMLVAPGNQAKRTRATAFIRAIREVGGKPGYLRETGTADMNVVAPIWQCPIIAYVPGIQASTIPHTSMSASRNLVKESTR